MSPINVNFDNMPDNNEPLSPEAQRKVAERYLVAPGRHVVRCTECKEEVSKNGNPMLVFDFEVVDGGDRGKSIRQWQTITEKALPIVKRYLSAVNYPMGSSESVDIDAGWFPGKTVLITVEHEEWNGRPVNRITNWENPPQSASRDADLPF